MAGDQQHIHDPAAAEKFARALGLMVGGHHPFVGDWQVKGLYAYRSGRYKGQAYFGTGGSESERLKDIYDPIKPGESNQKYRPWNRDDPKIPEEIRQKLVRWEDKNSINVVSHEITEASRVGTPLRTGWYRIEHADGSLVERVRVHRDERKTSATNEFIATGDLTGDVLWYVEGHTVNVPKFGSTGTLQADGNIMWDRDGNKAVYEGNVGEPILNSEGGMLQGEISLKGVHGKYLSATPEGRVLWNTDVAHVGEYFRVEQRQNGKIALRSAFDMYLSAQPDGRMECNRREAPPGGWEEFTIEYRSKDMVCLKSYHGKYLTAQKDGPWDWTMHQEADAQDIQIEPYRKTGEPVSSEPISNSDQKYVFAPEHKGWHWHNDRARAMGGHIASITSAKEDEDITRISGGAPVWLGGIRKGDRYRGKPIAQRKPGDPGDVGPGPEDWYWSDDRPWSYTNWGPGEPNNWDGGENRVQHLGKLGAVWNDVGEDWEGPAVYRIPANSRSRSVNVPRDESTDTVKLNHDGTDEVDAEPNKRRAIIVIRLGIFLMMFGLPLLIIGSISTAEDRLAMLIPGAVLMSVGGFALLISIGAVIRMGSTKGHSSVAGTGADNASTSLEVMLRAGSKEEVWMKEAEFDGQRLNGLIPDHRNNFTKKVTTSKIVAQHKVGNITRFETGLTTYLVYDRDLQIQQNDENPFWDID